MSISTNIQAGSNVTVTLTPAGNDSRLLPFEAVVSDVDSNGIYLHGSESGSGTFYPWSSIRRINY